MVGVDFNKTFVPMAKFITIRSSHGLGYLPNIHNNNIFYGFLKVEIYMDQTHDFVQEKKKHLVWKLNKAFYRLKQLPKACYHYINTICINESFFKSKANHFLYIKQTDKQLLAAILHVDDMSMLASNIS